MNINDLDSLRSYPDRLRLYHLRIEDLENAKRYAGTEEQRTQLDAMVLEYTSTICDHEQKYKSILDAVNMLPAIEAAVIRFRYIDRLSVKQIARRMNYNERHIYRIHSAALKHLKIEYK